MARIEQSDYAGAIEPVEEALDARRNAKGRDDIGVVNQLHSLAFLCRVSGNRYKLAEVNKEISQVMNGTAPPWFSLYLSSLTLRPSRNSKVPAM